jgi:hypothetical protein
MVLSRRGLRPLGVQTRSSSNFRYATALPPNVTQARRIDSIRHSIGFDNCSFAAQRRVLQHNLPGTDSCAAANDLHRCNGLLDQLVRDSPQIGT